METRSIGEQEDHFTGAIVAGAASNDQAAPILKDATSGAGSAEKTFLQAARPLDSWPDARHECKIEGFRGIQQPPIK